MEWEAPTDMLTVKKLYNYPAHADKLFDRIVRENLERGHSLHAVSKGYILGTGVSIRCEFAEQPDTRSYRMAHLYGRLRDESDPAFQQWRIFTVLPMKFFWLTIGYFYVLQRSSE